MANNLACLYVDTEKFDEAEPLHKEVLDLSERWNEFTLIDIPSELCWTTANQVRAQYKSVANESNSMSALRTLKCSFMG